jgi:ribonuclease VapC
MIVDSSAVISILFEEDGSDQLVNALASASLVAIGAPTLFETEMVAVGRFDLHGRALVAQFLERWGVEVTPFLDTHRKVAIDAFIRYGKGRHPAALNYGDCMTYATARLTELPLLCTGDDFAQTDIAVA